MLRKQNDKVDILQLEEELVKLRAEINELDQSNTVLKMKVHNLEVLVGQNPNIAAYQLIVDPDNDPRTARAISYTSSNFQDITGIEDPMDMDSWFESTHPDDIKKIVAGQEKALITGRLDVVIRKFHTQKQEWRWFHVMATITPDTSGALHYVNGMMLDITEYKRTENRLLAYQNNLRALNDQIITAEERERRRVAEVLHDEVGQELALALFKMNQARARQKNIEPVLDDIAPLVEQAISFTRSLTKELCPPALCQMGLVSGLEWLADRMNDQFQIQTRFQASGEFVDIDDQTGSLIFRTTAELLNNVAKHSESSTAEVFIERIDGKINLRVADDGVGFSHSAENLHESGGFGLFMISERMRSIGGDIEIDSAPDEGTSVRVEVPLVD